MADWDYQSYQEATPRVAPYYTDRGGLQWSLIKNPPEGTIPGLGGPVTLQHQTQIDVAFYAASIADDFASLGVVIDPGDWSAGVLPTPPDGVQVPAGVTAPQILSAGDNRAFLLRMRFHWRMSNIQPRQVLGVQFVQVQTSPSAAEKFLGGRDERVMSADGAVGYGSCPMVPWVFQSGDQVKIKVMQSNPCQAASTLDFYYLEIERLAELSPTQVCRRESYPCP